MIGAALLAADPDAAEWGPPTTVSGERGSAPAVSGDPGDGA